MGKLLELRGGNQTIDASWHKALPSNDNEQERYEELGTAFWCGRPKSLKHSSAFANNISSEKKSSTVFSTNLSKLKGIQTDDFVKMILDGETLVWQVKSIDLNDKGDAYVLTLGM